MDGVKRGRYQDTTSYSLNLGGKKYKMEVKARVVNVQHVVHSCKEIDLVYEMMSYDFGNYENTLRNWC